MNVELFAQIIGIGDYIFKIHGSKTWVFLPEEKKWLEITESKENH